MSHNISSFPLRIFPPSKKAKNWLCLLFTIEIIGCMTLCPQYYFLFSSQNIFPLYYQALRIFPLFLSEYSPPSAPTSCLSEYFLRIVLLFLSEYFPTLPPLPGSQNISSFFSEYFSPLPPLLVSNSFVLVRLTVANPPWSPYWKVKEGGETLEEFESTLPSLFR